MHSFKQKLKQRKNLFALTVLMSVGVGIFLATQLIAVQASSTPVNPDNITVEIEQTESKFYVNVGGTRGRTADIRFLGPRHTPTCNHTLFENRLSGARQPQNGNEIPISQNAEGKYYCTAISLDDEILKTTRLRVHYSIETRFKRGRLIDDTIFTDHQTMNAEEIQAFLENSMYAGRLGSHFCDRYGRRTDTPSREPKYTCLFEYQYNPFTKKDNYGLFNAKGEPLNLVGGQSAAQIIYRAAQDYEINPQVLLALIQREQALVTSLHPTERQFKYAAGYGCPDSTGCRHAPDSFWHQVRGAAFLLRKYIYHTTHNLHRYGNYGSVPIKTHPSSQCPSMQIESQNAATAALYTYTPYVLITKSLAEEVAPLNCKSNGNYHFWYFFNQSFGSSLSEEIQPDYEPKSEIRITPLNHQTNGQPYLKLEAPKHRRKSFLYFGSLSTRECDLSIFLNEYWQEVFSNLPSISHLDINLKPADDQKYYCFAVISKTGHLLAARSLYIEYDLLEKQPKTQQLETSPWTEREYRYFLKLPQQPLASRIYS